MMVFCCCMLACSARGIPEQQGPRDVVSNFYAWYIEESNDIRKNPIKDEIMYRYVYACTVNKCRIDLKQANLDANYFLRGNDFYYERFKSLTVHAPVSINDSIALVPVGFGDEKPSILVFVQKTKDGWRIIKVEDSWY